MKSRMQFAVVLASVALASSPALCDNIVTQTINNVEWRFRLNPATGTATLGLGGDNEATWACPKVAVDAADIPWKFTGTDGVQYTVTEIAAQAFHTHTKLSGVLTIPSSVKKINAHAFLDVGEGLTRLKGMEGVTSLGSYTFRNAKNMEVTDLDLSGITNCPASPFQNCSKLTMPIKLNTSLKSIAEVAFHSAYFSGTVVIPASVDTVGANANNGMFVNAPNFTAIWVKGKPAAASQSYTTVYCRKFAQNCKSMKVILMGKNTKGGDVKNTASSAMLGTTSGVDVFIPANGYWDSLVLGGTSNNKWEYGSDKDFDLDIDDVNMRVTITPNNATMLVKSLEWATLFKQHFLLEPRICVTQTLDLSDVTITEAMTQDITFDRLMFSAKTQSELTSILETFPKSTPIAIDPAGLVEDLTIPDEYSNVFVKSAPGTKVKKTVKGIVISLR